MINLDSINSVHKDNLKHTLAIEARKGVFSDYIMNIFSDFSQLCIALIARTIKLLLLILVLNLESRYT